MSRIGNRPVELPDGVEPKIEGTTLSLSGPKGELERTFADHLELNVEDGALVVRRRDDSRESRSQHGLARSLVSNMVKGVADGYVKHLEIEGVGYRAEMRGNFVRFDLGFSHPVMFELPASVECEIERQTKLKLESPNKELLGQVAAKIRDLRPPEPYNGKGIRYRDEVVRRKAGKAGA